MKDPAVWIAVASFIVAGVSLMRAEQVRRAVRHARPGERLRRPLATIRDAFEVVAATPGKWRNRKREVGSAKKDIESEMAGIADPTLRATLVEIGEYVQEAFETGVPADGGSATAASALQQIALKGERAAKNALDRIAELGARV